MHCCLLFSPVAAGRVSSGRACYYRLAAVEARASRCCAVHAAVVAGPPCSDAIAVAAFSVLICSATLTYRRLLRVACPSARSDSFTYGVQVSFGVVVVAHSPAGARLRLS